MAATDTAPTLCRPKTCKTCPFRGGSGLRDGRRQQIWRAVMVDDQTFSCHSEVGYDVDDGDPDAEPDASMARQCAGATTLALREDAYNQVMRLDERLSTGPVQDDAVPFSSWAEWLAEDKTDAVPSKECCGGECDGHTCEVVGPDCECPAGYMGGGGVVENPDRLEDPAFCEACGNAMCGACQANEWHCVECETDGSLEW